MRANNSFLRVSRDELLQMYFSFFEDKGHTVIPSASVIPENDPSVLFTMAGMHPLVPYLQGREHPSGTRLVNCQKCIRTNDIELVGDASHLTFFEMLGNWSLGDYFKSESIAWSYEFLTSPDYLNIPVDRLWVSIFSGGYGIGLDEESAEVWRSLGISEDRIVPLGAEHNWWAAGDEGPCGPDTEIFVDMTESPCDAGAKCLPGECECGRFFEIWNNVFMSYDRSGDKVTELPQRNVDTGMGLERTLATLTGCDTVYETSSFKPIFDALIDRSQYSRGQITENAELTRALRIIGDHLRTAVIVIGDPRGVTPSNLGAGYVLRRLIRRAVRFCSSLGIASDDWVAVGRVVIEIFSRSYPELTEKSEQIIEQLALEKDRFEKVLKKGSELMMKEVQRLQSAGESVLPGEIAFRLYDTYGFPIEFTEELAAEQGLTVDTEEYARRFEQHRQVSKTDTAKSGLADTSSESIRYHTATHLLHAALREVLGTHVEQKGSNITQERLRFDFSHPAAMTKEEKEAVEKWVQDVIDREIPVTSAVMPYDEAVKLGAIGLFEDKYENDVSVYTIGDVSAEVCSGPHVSNTSEIGKFKIKKEKSSSAGVRRIRAVVS